MKIVRIVATLLPLALGACEMTSFSNVPEGASDACPKPLVGAWIGLEDRPGGDADFGFVVHGDCSIESRNAKGDRHPAQPPLPRLKSWSGRGQLVFVATAAGFELVELNASEEDEKPEGYVAYEWKRDGDVATITGVDDRRVATLIVNGAIHGRTRVDNTQRKTTGDVINHVEESPADTARVLRDLDLFAGRPKSFRRVGDDAKALERALKAAAKKAKK